MSECLDRFGLNYAAAFTRYLVQRDEAALRSAYELGRAGVVDGISLLDVAQIHHTTLVDVLRAQDGHGWEETAAAAAAFLLEVLASFEMTRRGFLEKAAEPGGPPHV